MGQPTFRYLENHYYSLTRERPFGPALRGRAARAATAGRPCEAFGFEFFSLEAVRGKRVRREAPQARLRVGPRGPPRPEVSGEAALNREDRITMVSKYR